MTSGNRFGIISATELVFRWIARRLFHYREAGVYHLDLAAIPALAGCQQIEWTCQSSSEINGARILEARLDSSDSYYFVGSVNGKRCYSSVVSRRGFSVPDRIGVTFLSGTDAYVGDCITEPEHRGRGIYPCGLVELAVQLRSAGMKSLCLFVESDNLASRRSVHKAGFRQVGVCWVWRLGRKARRGWRVFDEPANPSGLNWRVDIVALPALRS